MMGAWPVLFMVAVLGASTIVSVATDGTDVDWWALNKRLKDTLMADYDRTVLPQRTHNGSVPVYLDTIIRGLWLDEATQILHINMWVVMVWHDLRLSWDPKDYGGLNRLYMGEDELWKPDITVYNNADLTEIDHYGNTHAIVYSKWVYWVPPAHVQVECPMDLAHWPYDSHTCNVHFGSWTAHGWQIELNYLNFTRKVSHDYLLKGSHHWQLTGGTLRRIEMTYEDVPEPYITMHLKLNITRLSPTYSATVVAPAIVVSLLTLTQFILPLTDPKRVTVGCTALLLSLLELLYLAVTLPPLATSLPIIVKFYGQTVVVVVVSVMVCAIILRLGHGGISYPPPPMVKTLLTGPLATFLFLHDYTQKVGHGGGGGEDGEVLAVTAVGPNYTPEWLLVAAALDRVASLVFLATFFITLIAYVTIG